MLLEWVNIVLLNDQKCNNEIRRVHHEIINEIHGINLINWSSRILDLNIKKLRGSNFVVVDLI